MAFERAPLGYGHSHAVISVQKLSDRAREYKLIAGFDKEALNEPRSYSVSGRA